MTLSAKLKQWHKGTVSELAEIYLRYADVKSFVPDLIAALTSNESQTAAAWLLKHHQENNAKLSLAQQQRILSQLGVLSSWEAKLNILQCLPNFTIAQSSQTQVDSFLRICLAGDNKFVRAWAYNGFYLLAQQYPSYRPEVEAFFEMAMRDEAPSVKSRVLKLMKQGFK